MTNAKQFDHEKSRRMVTVLVLFFILMSVIIPAGTQKVYAADGTIQLKVGRVIDYAKYITHYYYAGDKDSPVYCVQPQLAAVPAGTYSYDFISPD